MAKYKALVGIDYPPSKRAEAGDIIEDLDGKSIKWLLEAGYIEAADAKTAKAAPAPVEETPVEEPAPAEETITEDAPVESETE